MLVALGDDGLSKPISAILRLPLDKNSGWIKGPDFTCTISCHLNEVTFLYGSRSVITNDGKTLFLVGGLRGAATTLPNDMLRKFWCSTAQKCYWTEFEGSPLKMIRYDVMAFMAPSWMTDDINCRE